MTKQKEIDSAFDKHDGRLKVLGICFASLQSVTFSPKEKKGSFKQLVKPAIYFKFH